MSTSAAETNRKKRPNRITAKSAYHSLGVGWPKSDYSNLGCKSRQSAFMVADVGAMMVACDE